MRIIFVLLSFFLLSTCDKELNGDSSEVNKINSLEIIKGDMILPHEGVLNGLPTSVDWSSSPRIGMGNKPPTDWFSMIPWGQVYRDPNPILVSNTRIQIKHIQAWYLNDQNEWINWASSDEIFGNHYYEDYSEDFNIKAEIRQENSGGISIQFRNGYIFHFWPSNGRTTMNPQTINGVWISVEARLILHDSKGTDDRNLANFMLGVGGDYWKSNTAVWDNFNTNADIGIGRLKYITNEWKAFNMHTLTIKQLNTVPPPF